MDVLATTHDVARRYRVTVDTVRTWVRQNRIPYVRITSRTLRYDLDAVDAALRNAGAQKGAKKSCTPV